MAKYRVYEDDRGRTEWFLNAVGVLVEANSTEEAIAKALNDERILPGHAYHIEPIEGSAAFVVNVDGSAYVDIDSGEWSENTIVPQEEDKCHPVL